MNRLPLCQLQVAKVGLSFSMEQKIQIFNKKIDGNWKYTHKTRTIDKLLINIDHTKINYEQISKLWLTIQLSSLDKHQELVECALIIKMVSNWQSTANAPTSKTIKNYFHTVIGRKENLQQKIMVKKASFKHLLLNFIVNKRNLPKPLMTSRRTLNTYAHRYSDDYTWMVNAQKLSQTKL